MAEDERSRADHRQRVERGRADLLRQVLASSRFFIGFAILGSFLSAVTLIVYGFLTVGKIIIDLFGDEISYTHAKTLSVEFIELTDVFLLGTVLYIVALGLYELFVDSELPVPDWLRVSDLDDLKEKLVGVIIVLLGVTFLGEATGGTSGQTLFYEGIGIAVVIFALNLIRLANAIKHAKNGDEEKS